MSREIRTHQSFLTYRGWRWAWIGTASSVAAIVAYMVHEPVSAPNGGTTLGTILGLVGAGLIVWLMLLGLRKRSYRARGAPLVGWVSAHVYLGLALVVISTLHTGFQVGFNLHGLAYVLVLIVVGSGLFGVVAYTRLPRMMNANLAGTTLAATLAGIADHDRAARDAAASLGGVFSAAVLRASQETKVGGHWMQQLRGHDPTCGTLAALQTVREASHTLEGPERQAAQEVLQILSRKGALLLRARRDVQLRAWLQVWLALHVPMSFALLAALAAHVVAVMWLR